MLIKDLPDRKRLEEAKEQYPDLDPEIMEVYLHFLKSKFSLSSEIGNYLGEYGISGGRMSILMQLLQEQDKATPPSALADRCSVTPATVSGLIDGLIRANLVERVIDPQDRRVQPVRLTKEGREHMEAMLPGYFKLVNQLFGVLDEEERAALLGILKKLESNFITLRGNDET